MRANHSPHRRRRSGGAVRALAGALLAAGLASPARGQCQLQKLRAPLPDAYDGFGVATGVIGEWLLVGSPNDDDRATNAGAVYVYRRSAPLNWGLEGKLYASDADPTNRRRSPQAGEHPVRRVII